MAKVSRKSAKSSKSAKSNTSKKSSKKSSKKISKKSSNQIAKKTAKKTAPKTATTVAKNATKKVAKKSVKKAPAKALPKTSVKTSAKTSAKTSVKTSVKTSAKTSTKTSVQAKRATATRKTVSSKNPGPTSIAAIAPIGDGSSWELMMEDGTSVDVRAAAAQSVGLGVNSPWDARVAAKLATAEDEQIAFTAAMQLLAKSKSAWTKASLLAKLGGDAQAKRTVAALVESGWVR